MSKRVGIRSSSKPSPGTAKGLDGTPASLGKAREIQKGCALCGAVGHKSTDHAGGKAVIGGKGADDDDGHGPAKDMNKATQGDFNDSRYNTGSPNYKAPGSEGGMS